MEATISQKVSVYNLCARYTNYFLPVNLVRLDERTGWVFVLIGEETEIVVYPRGGWKYL